MNIAVKVGRIGSTSIYEREDGSKFVRSRLAVQLRQGDVTKTVWYTIFSNSVALAEYLTRGRLVLVIGHEYPVRGEDGSTDLVLRALHIELLPDYSGLLRRLRAALGLDENATADEIVEVVERLAGQKGIAGQKAEQKEAARPKARKIADVTAPAKTEKEGAEEPVAVGAEGGLDAFDDDEIPF